MVGWHVLLRLAACGLMAVPVALGWWMIVDDIRPARMLASPFPYLTLFVAFAFAIPVYLGFRDWIDRSALNALGLTTAWIGTLAFWIPARRIRK